jgi:hypothetical protein
MFIVQYYLCIFAVFSSARLRLGPSYLTWYYKTNSKLYCIVYYLQVIHTGENKSPQDIIPQGITRKSTMNYVKEKIYGIYTFMTVLL